VIRTDHAHGTDARADGAYLEDSNDDLADATALSTPTGARCGR